MLNQLRSFLVSHLQNLPGWKTDRKFIVLESDDWGSIRMPSEKVYTFLLNKGFKVNTDPFLKFDSLADIDDLSGLFEVLSSTKDKHGNPAVMTANTIVANPDFNKIRESDFQNYYFEPFTTTLKRYSNHSRSFDLWREGMDHKVFHPQFHGREHVNVARWMKALQRNDANVRQAFDLEMISISSEPSEMQFGYMESLDYFSDTEKSEKQIILSEGLHLFKEIFGYDSRSFIATCFVWNNENEKTLNIHGVEFIQGIARQLTPSKRLDKHSFRHLYHYTGETNKAGQVYLTRNAYFEPCLYPGSDQVNSCLQRIDTAFKLNKPAIISTHRLNFIGFINKRNRDNNIIQFNTLLKTILKKWPDVEFITSDQLGELIKGRDQR